MTTLREAVARAICEEEWNGTQHWDHKPEGFKKCYRETADAAIAAVLDAVGMKWKPMETAPKDRPILAWCVKQCSNPGCENESPFGLCLYHAHAEGLASAKPGFNILEWGGSWDVGTWEDPHAGYLPDWWFVRNTDFEVVASPILWTDIEPPTEEMLAVKT